MLRIVTGEVFLPFLFPCLLYMFHSVQGLRWFMQSYDLYHSPDFGVLYIHYVFAPDVLICGTPL